jgi:hypothetical protein
MAISLDQTPEYRRGRNGEILMHSFAIEHGCTVFDIGGTGHGAAPLLAHKFGNIIAPDALHIRKIPIFAEYKTKTNAFDWRGGPRDLAEHVPPCLMQGIEAHAFHEYRRINKQMPVVLWFLTINSGQLHVAWLDELGEPFPSVNPDFHIVNWPLQRMRRVASFDAKRLRAWFAKERENRLPAPMERRELLRWLQPRQLEFDSFIDHFLEWHETRGAA